MNKYKIPVSNNFYRNGLNCCLPYYDLIINIKLTVE